MEILQKLLGCGPAGGEGFDHRDPKEPPTSPIKQGIQHPSSHHQKYIKPIFFFFFPTKSFPKSFLLAFLLGDFRLAGGFCTGSRLGGKRDAQRVALAARVGLTAWKQRLEDGTTRDQ